MKIEVKDSSEERTILIGMIVDKTVLGRVTMKWERDMFSSKWANLISGWCRKYYDKYKKAPGTHIKSLFSNWSKDNRNEKLVDLVGGFLDGLSKQYVRLEKESNSDYIVDLAGKYFNRIKLERLIEQTEANLTNNDTDKAVADIANFRQIELGVGKGIFPFEDKEAIKKCFEEEHKCLIKYPHGLGKFFEDRLERDGFIAFMSPDKRGKSFWMLDIAYRAMIQGRRVAYFECGDNSESQIMRRFMTRAARHPRKAGDVKYPVTLELDEEDEAQVGHETRKFTEPLGWKKSYKACKNLIENKKCFSKLRLSCHFNSTLNVDGIRGVLDIWDKDEWIPDVIVIDYADIMNLDHHGLEGRDRIDYAWKQLRRLSQERHCLVVTATQSDAAAYDVNTLSKKHFSEDKRKIAHVTGMIGINQTNKEKEQGLMRLNWIVLREDYFSESKCCYVATCLPLANIAVRSLF